MKQLREAGSRPPPPRTSRVSPGSPWRPHLPDHPSRPPGGKLKEEIFVFTKLLFVGIPQILSSPIRTPVWSGQGIILQHLGIEKGTPLG